MLWVIAFHVIFVICWFAGIFYLPRLFVYHAMTEDKIGIDRFKMMERKLFWGIMTPSGILASIFGFWALTFKWDYYETQNWMHAKLILALFLWIYHAVCYKYLLDFKHDRNTHSHVFYRWFNEVPTVLLIVIVILAFVKP